MASTRTTGDIATTTSAISTAICTTAVPGKYGSVPPDACNANYNFDPSFETNVVFAALFGCSLIVHIIQAFAWKKKYCWVVVMGVSWEFFAFIVKSVGARNQQQTTYAVVGQIFFLLAPLWTNAFAFMTVARLVYYVLPDQSLLRVKATTLTKLLVWFDVACFLVQATGGILMSNDDPGASLIRTGQYIYMGGCGAQLAFILVFCAMMGRFTTKIERDSRPILNMAQVRMLVWALYAVLSFIVVRLTFRLIEFGKGPDIDNPILTNEYYAIGLDALPMLMAFLLLNAVHPGWVLRGPESEFPRMSRKEKKQLKRGKKDAKKEAMNATEAATSANKRGKLPTERHSSTASYEMLEPLDAYTGGSAVNQRDQQ